MRHHPEYRFLEPEPEGGFTITFPEAGIAATYGASWDAARPHRPRTCSFRAILRQLGLRPEDLRQGGMRGKKLRATLAYPALFVPDAISPLPVGTIANRHPVAP
jgi:hypothetical protein